MEIYTIDMKSFERDLVSLDGKLKRFDVIVGDYYYHIGERNGRLEIAVDNQICVYSKASNMISLDHKEF